MAKNSKKTKTVKVDFLSQIKVTNTKNCLSCSRYLKCEKEEKAFDYVCSKFLAFGAKEKKPRIVDEIKSPAIKKKEDQRDRDFDFEGLVEDAIEFEKTSPLPRDLKIDDRDIKQHPNFFSFVTSPNGLNIEPYPFAKQIEIGTHLFSEYCPRCSDSDYIENIPVRHKPERILERVQFLEFGVCPNCHVTRSELYCEKELKVPCEIAVMAGQRCVTGDTILLTNNGLMRMDEIVKMSGYGSRGYGNRLKGSTRVVDEKGRLNQIIAQHRIEPEQLIRIRTKAGHEITGTKDHPVYGVDQFVKLRKIREGDYIKYTIGQNVWPTVMPTMAEYTRDLHFWLIKKLSTTKKPGNFPLSYFPKKLSPELARLMGYWVSEGCGGQRNKECSGFTISQLPGDAYDDIYSCIVSQYSHQIVSEGNSAIRVASPVAAKHMDLLVGGLRHKSADKKIPDIIRKSPKPIVKEFLRALFEGDGCCYNNRVEYTTISKQLSNQLFCILQNMGIPCTRTFFKTWARNGSENQVRKNGYIINIQGWYAVEKFAQEIGFVSDRKNNALKKALLIKTDYIKDMPHWYDKYPEEIKQELIDLIWKNVRVELHNTPHYCPKQKHMGIQTVYGGRCPGLRLLKKNRIVLSRQRLLNILEPLESFRHYFSVETNKRIGNLFKLANDRNIIYTYVKTKTKTKKRIRTYDITVPKYHRFIANGLLNHNSGKSETFGMLSAYHLHTYLKSPSPQKMYGLLPNTDLHAMYTALTWQKAKDLLWDKIRPYLANSPWYKEYHECLAHYGQKYSEELFQVKDTYARYRHRSLFMYPVGPDKNKLRGTTAFQAGIDEIGLFSVEENSTKVKMNGEEVYVSVRNSFRTLRSAYYKRLKKGHNNILPPFFGCISSPLSKKDMIVQLYEKSLNSKFILGRHYATWEYNPNITKKDLAEEFRDNPVKALRDFGAVAPNSALPYIEDIDQVVPIVEKKRRNAVTSHTILQESRAGMKHRSARLVFKQPKDQNRRILAIDAGEVNNSFALTLGYWDIDLEKPVFDCMLEVQPAPKQSINFTFIYEDVIIPLIENMNVGLVVADRWNSGKFLTDIAEQFDCQVERYSVKYGEFMSFKEDILNGELVIPKPEMPAAEIMQLGEKSYPSCFIGKPIAHFVYQLLTVQDNQKIVTKGEGTTDDLLRSTVLAYSFLIDPDYREFVSGKTLAAPSQDTVIGAVGVYSSGSTGRNAAYGLGVVSSRGGLMIRR
jgi:intein/homing endonuclease